MSAAAICERRVASVETCVSMSCIVALSSRERLIISTGRPVLVSRSFAYRSAKAVQPGQKWPPNGIESPITTTRRTSPAWVAAGVRAGTWVASADAATEATGGLSKVIDGEVGGWLLATTAHPANKTEQIDATADAGRRYRTALIRASFLASMPI